MKSFNLIGACILSTASILLPASASAQSLDAHVHGEANMAIVIDGQHLSASLMSAMYNITGFEHAPETEEQREVLQTAKSLLEDGTQLFRFNSEAECFLTSSHHNLSSTEDRHDTNEDKPEADGEHHHNHRDLEADYEFTCKKPSKLSSVRVGLFDHFKNLQKVNVVTLTGGQQSAAELTPKRETLSLSGS
nr:DUF2796 domain-containing protein [uncultured Hyphomonas sp.]